MWRSPYVFLVAILVAIFFAYSPALQSASLYWIGAKELSNLPTIAWLGLTLHLANVLLVYLLSSTLLKNSRLALFISLLWGLHPLHADSVAWAIRQGYLLFSCFYLLSLLLYVFYLRNIAGEQTKKWIFYGLSLLSFFTASYLYSSLGLGLLAFLLLDFYEKRTWHRQVYADKLPYLVLWVLSTFVGIKIEITYFTNASPTVGQQFWLGGYALGIYLFRFFVPLNWSIINPVVIDKSTLLVGVVVAVLTIGLLLVSVRKKWFIREQWFFGFLFFMLHLLPSLRIPTDGYFTWMPYKSYLPYIGVCFLLVSVYHTYIANKISKYFTVVVFLCLALCFSYLSYQRTTAWQNMGGLLTQVIQNYPKDELAYYLRGNIYLWEKNYEKAHQDLDKANLLNPDAVTTFQLAHVLNKLNDFKNSIKAYDLAVKMRPDLANTFRYLLDMAFNSAYIYDAPKAKEFFAKAEPLATTNELKAEWYLYYAMYYIRYLDFDEAIESCEKALSFNPSLADAYTNLGTVKLYQGKLDEALAYLKQADALKPNDKIILGNLAVCYRDKKDTLMANYYAQRYQLLTGKDK